jgi:SAM-dependent methyltransferase
MSIRSHLQNHWDKVYAEKSWEQVSWHQKTPEPSLTWIDSLGLAKEAGILDMGSGESYLIDSLLQKGYTHMLAIDIAQEALDKAKQRQASSKVQYLCADAARLPELPALDLWHDRAVFHFLTDESDRQAYLNALKNSLKPNGYLLLATFAPDGPLKCSGLDICQYSTEDMQSFLGPEFALLKEARIDHTTPSGSVQKFNYALFQFLPK